MIDLKGLAIGIKNYNFPKREVEELAKQRIEKMKLCPNFKKEENKFFQVEDKRIEDASGMTCTNCGCVAAYKIRQNNTKCECWEEN